MNRASDMLQGYRGANPFRETQARAGSGAAIISEFFATSTFWSLFNDQHEILLGTRGSGKTFLLRMMSYSLLRRFQHDNAKKHIKNRSFIGFYIPLHLEFLASLPGKSHSDENRMGYFQFAFNCAAAKALLTEVAALLEDTFHDPTERLLAEAKIIRLCSALWFAKRSSEITTIADLQWELELLYGTTPFWSDDATEIPPLPLARNILTPIASILPKLSEALNLNPDTTKWVACIDEAEFLSAAFLKCVNTFLRSDKRPLVVKIATLPFKHSTRDTLTPGVFIEPRGNDYSYILVDLAWDSTDFKGLTDYISNVRLARAGCPKDTGLESFLGTVGDNDDLIDYFKAELGDEASSNETLLKEIVSALSSIRQQNFEQIRNEFEKVERPYLHRFAPVYFTRRMRLENKKEDGSRHGSRELKWCAGFPTVTRAALFR